MPALSLTLCGPVAEAVRVDGARPSVPLGAKDVALLAYLALERREHTRESLAALLWGETPDEKARMSLRQSLAHLRGVVGDALRVSRDSVMLAGAVACDALDLPRLVRDHPDAALAIDPSRFLGGITIKRCPEFDEWADGRRRALANERSVLLARLTREALARLAWREAAALAERWAAADPHADEPIAARVEALFQLGDRDSALAAFRRHRESLGAEGRKAGSALAALVARVERAPNGAAMPARRPEPASDARRPLVASLVGRVAEWDVLRDAWAATASGGGRLVLVEGEPGIGKSRLVGDFLRWVETDGGTVLRAAGLDSTATAPLGLAAELVRAAIDAPGLAGVDPHWLAELTRLAPALRTHFPGLPDTRTVPLDRWRMFEAIAQVVQALGEEGRVVVYVDDVASRDDESCRLLHHLVRRFADAPVLWCVVHTPAAADRGSMPARLWRALRAMSHATRIALEPLRETDVWQIVRECGRIDTPNGARRFAARLHALAEGSPYYVFELIATLFAHGWLVEDEATGQWYATASEVPNVADLALVPRVHAAIAERLARLPGAQHAMLITLAVSESGCSTDVLSHVHGISRLRAAMLGDRLVERHLAVERDGAYRCAHALIAHVVREGLGTSRRREVDRSLGLARKRAPMPDDAESNGVAAPAYGYVARNDLDLPARA